MPSSLGRVATAAASSARSGGGVDCSKLCSLARPGFRDFFLWLNARHVDTIFDDFILFWAQGSSILLLGFEVRHLVCDRFLFIRREIFAQVVFRSHFLLVEDDVSHSVDRIGLKVALG